MNNAFTYLLRVRYAECDAQKVVFNAKYAEYIDVAATEYIRAVYGSFDTLLQKGYDNQVVSLKIDWQSSATFDDIVGIRMHTSHIGNSSFTITAEIYNHETNAVFAIGSLVYVFVSVETYAKTSIPDDFRQVIAQGAPGLVVNHAGVELSS